MKRALLFLFCALISTQMFSESSSPYGTATSFAKTDVASTTFNNDIEDISSDLRKKYLVEKITWYDDETNHKEAYYEYDNNNRLVRRIIHNTYFEQGRVKHDTIVDNYEYTEGNLTKISHKDVYVSYTYDLEYDNAGRLITSKYGNNIMHFCYRGGKMDSIWYDNDPECYTILKYDEHGNIVKEIMRVPETEMDDIGGKTPTGDYVFIENEYEYDDKIRPFFNIDNAFVYDPIFGQGTTHPVYIRMLSTNNLIKYSRSSWHYTYNEEGLPIELRSRFEGVTPVNDPKYVFTYRKIEKHQSSYKDQWCDTWNVFVENGSVYPPHEETYRYQLAQDIVIGDYTYTAVVSKAINDALDAPHYVAAVRFTDDRKVYIYYDNAEYLLYDFNVQEGEELEVFAGINNYTSEIKTYKCTVTGVEQYAYVGCPATITLEVHNHPDDFREFYRLTQWIEGVGDINGFLNGINHYVEMDGGGSEYLLCAYKGDELKYTGDLYEEYGCGDDAEQSPEDLFPTLWGLQRTDIEEHTTCDGKPYLSDFEEYVTTQMNGKLYLSDGRNYLREENNQVLFCCPDFEIYEDIVLYDWTLEIGDTLPHNKSTVHAESDFIVKNVSTVTLLDGKKYKKWTLACGYEYIEGIGAINGEGYGHYLCLESWVQPGTYIRTCLVCASRNGQLLYQMDEAEMERWGAECLCDGYQSSYKDQWCDTWNVLYHGWDPEGGDDPYMPYTFIYQLEEDTTINDLTYQRLTGRFSLSTMPSNKEYVAALRFSENKKVFIHYDDTEYLLYDFGAQVGDTLEIFGGIDHYKDFKTLTHVITEIDSLDDGRLQIYSNAIIQESEGYETPFERLYPKIWIEGVGSKDGIVQNSATNRIPLGPCVLLCAYHNDDCIYTTDNPYYTPYGCVHNDSFFTATEEVNAPTQSVQKIMYNGQLLILRDSKTYNVMGMEVTK